MNYRILILGILILISSKGFANNLNDTVNVTIDLRQVDSLGLKVCIYAPSDLKGLVKYQFPRSIPGIYEYLNNHESIIDLSQNGIRINYSKNSYQINCDLSNNTLTYFAKSTVDRFKGIFAKDTYYLKDSIYILNWHYILGFFNSQTKRPYKIKIIKNADLLGTGSLAKKVKNDTTDIYIATNYKELIHNPIMYSIPDTTDFMIGETNFTISCAGNDSLLDSKKIKDLLIVPLTEILSESEYKHENYSFLFYSEYSLKTPYLTGLEHPNSTLICYHTALLDKKILVSSSIHEFIHAIYAPLRIRSEVINEFNFVNPKCDKLLWFYEGVTEYLSIKTLFYSGVYTIEDFLNEMEYANSNHKNIVMSTTSRNIYDTKEQKLFDNFYTKGSLFSMLLDLEIIKLSNGEYDLFSTMNALQKEYKPDTPLNSNEFINDFSLYSNVNIQPFIEKYVNHRKKINLHNIANEVGYSYYKIDNDSSRWSFDIKKIIAYLNFKKDKMEYVIFGSVINKEYGVRKLRIKEIDNESITHFNNLKLLSPISGDALTLLINDGKADSLITVTPSKLYKPEKVAVWRKNDNFNSPIAKKYWSKE